MGGGPRRRCRRRAALACPPDLGYMCVCMSSTGEAMRGGRAHARHITEVTSHGVGDSLGARGALDHVGVSGVGGDRLEQICVCVYICGGRCSGVRLQCRFWAMGWARRSGRRRFDSPNRIAHLDLCLDPPPWVQIGATSSIFGFGCIWLCRALAATCAGPERHRQEAARIDGACRVGGGRGAKRRPRALTPRCGAAVGRRAGRGARARP